MNEPEQSRSLISRLGQLLEDSFLTALLVALITIATGQIVLRNVFHSSLPWTDELLRLLVLWLAMAAAVTAARDDRHISIDVLSRFLEGRWLAGSRLLIAAFTAAVCGLLAWHSGRFVNDSRLYEDILLGGVPAWILQGVMPLAFALMTWRYLAHALRHLLVLLRGEH
ncbi:MAG: TRAP transporter small permease [Gammaproteobacteria bacterium]|nr:TRAP transporter small permease [Gammaproteobacteria bacterium]